jgi:hypothetical protein
MTRRWLELLGGLAAVGVGGVVAYRLIFRPWHIRWGATDEEVARPMPGVKRRAEALAEHRHEPRPEGESPSAAESQPSSPHPPGTFLS